MLCWVKLDLAITVTVCRLFVPKDTTQYLDSSFGSLGARLPSEYLALSATRYPRMRSRVLQSIIMFVHHLVVRKYGSSRASRIKWRDE